MKTLPKYFCIKRDPNNPLWDKYINWLNIKNPEWNYDWIHDWYYWKWKYDDVIRHKEDFDFELAKLITLEEWNAAVYPEQDPNEKSFKIQLTYETIIRRSDWIEFKKDTINWETIEEVKKQISELRTKANKLQGLLKFHSNHF